MGVENEVTHGEHQLIFHVVNESGLLVVSDVELVEFAEVLGGENRILLVLEVVVPVWKDEPDGLSAKLNSLEFDLITDERIVGKVDFLKGLGLWVISVQEVLVLSRIGISLIEVEDEMGAVDR